MLAETFTGDLYSGFVRKVVAPLWAWQGGRSRQVYLRRFEKAHVHSPAETQCSQWQRLQQLLRHACRHSPFYAERMHACGMRPEDFRTWHDLGRLPFLTREEVRAHRQRLLASPPVQLLPLPNSLGGGDPEFVIDGAGRRFKQANSVAFRQWTGWRLGEKMAEIGEHPRQPQSWRQKVFNLLLERCITPDTLPMDEAAMLRFYREIRRQRPTLLSSPSSDLLLFARFLRHLGLQDIRPRGIISSTTALNDLERREIEAQFHCRVTNQHSSPGIGLIASECPEHRGLHLNLDTVLVEILRDGSPVSSGQPGELVVTDLTNFGMPLIRYRTGDFGIPSERSCPCGCRYPLLETIISGSSYQSRHPGPERLPAECLAHRPGMKIGSSPRSCSVPDSSMERFCS